MKISVNSILVILLCIALVCAALCIGAVRGWNEERNQALTALTQEGELHTQLQNRGMDAANLCVVAARHLSADDPDLVALRQASQTLLSGTDDVQVIFSADEQITETALHFAQSLPELESVQGSARDSNYVAMLPSALGRRSSLTHTYTLMVEDFNERLSTSIFGKLATLLGVDPLPALDAD